MRWLHFNNLLCIQFGYVHQALISRQNFHEYSKLVDVFYRAVPNNISNSSVFMSSCIKCERIRGTKGSTSGGILVNDSRLRGRSFRRSVLSIPSALPSRGGGVFNQLHCKYRIFTPNRTSGRHLLIELARAALAAQRHSLIALFAASLPSADRDSIYNEKQVRSP